MRNRLHIETIGLMGFGAFGQLVARHLAPHFTLLAHDPGAEQKTDGIRFVDPKTIGGCDLVILAVPVSEMAAAIRQIRDHLKPGTIVADVGSVKVGPAAVMARELPSHVEILGTHPLFGPQSARTGLAGHKVALCPVRGGSALRIGAFLRKVLRLKVYVTTPDAHDREAAVVQGITHLIAKVLVQMEPLPKRLTTASFEHILAAVEMVRYDATSVFQAIERQNPYAPQVRERFFTLAAEARAELEAQS